MSSYKNSNQTLIDVVDTLSSIADLELDHKVVVSQKHERTLRNQSISYKTIHWYHPHSADSLSSFSCIKETYRNILYFLIHFYQNKYDHYEDEVLNQIKNIMSLVEDAANQIDTHNKSLQLTGSVKDFQEYQQLHELYSSEVDQVLSAKVVEDNLVNQFVLQGDFLKPIENLEMSGSEKAFAIDKENLAKIKQIDFEAVKKDTEYELFLIQKENGGQFFSPRLLRNIKLSLEFDGLFGDKKERDLLESIPVWFDKTIQVSAKEIVRFAGQRITQFFKGLKKTNEQVLSGLLAKAIVALMMASHNSNLLRHHPVKSSHLYFEDFQKFLRDILTSSTYLGWMKNRPAETHQEAWDLIDLVQSLCRAIYSQLKGQEEMIPFINELIEKAGYQHLKDFNNDKKLKRVAHLLTATYHDMNQIIKNDSNGPVENILSLIEQNKWHSFNTLQQGNVPNQLYDFYTQEKRCSFLRIPSPVHQLKINHAHINEEFKGFILNYGNGSVEKKHLLINLQDRTSWREHARCVAIENFAEEKEVMQSLSVVTLAINTDFYHQRAPYHDVNQANTFLSLFKEIIFDHQSGYYFPAQLKTEELENFVDNVFKLIHEVFFSSKNVMVRESRLAFIEIFHLFFQLKLIDWLQPDSISLSCKDGVDLGQAYSAGLFALVKLINNAEWSDADWRHLNFLMYAPALLIRKRLMLPERFNRLANALKVMENARYEYGSDEFFEILKNKMNCLFQTSIFTSQILLP